MNFDQQYARELCLKTFGSSIDCLADQASIIVYQIAFYIFITLPDLCSRATRNNCVPSFQMVLAAALGAVQAAPSLLPGGGDRLFGADSSASGGTSGERRPTGILDHDPVFLATALAIVGHALGEQLSAGPADHSEPVTPAETDAPSSAVARDGIALASNLVAALGDTAFPEQQSVGRGLALASDIVATVGQGVSRDTNQVTFAGRADPDVGDVNKRQFQSPVPNQSVRPPQGGSAWPVASPPAPTEQSVFPTHFPPAPAQVTALPPSSPRPASQLPVPLSTDAIDHMSANFPNFGNLFSLIARAPPPSTSALPRKTAAPVVNEQPMQVSNTAKQSIGTHTAPSQAESLAQTGHLAAFPVAFQTPSSLFGLFSGLPHLSAPGTSLAATAAPSFPAVGSLNHASQTADAGLKGAQTFQHTQTETMASTFPSGLQTANIGAELIPAPDISSTAGQLSVPTGVQFGGGALAPATPEPTLDPLAVAASTSSQTTVDASQASVDSHNALAFDVAAVLAAASLGAHHATEHHEAAHAAAQLQVAAMQAAELQTTEPLTSAVTLQEAHQSAAHDAADRSAQQQPVNTSGEQEVAGHKTDQQVEEKGLPHTVEQQTMEPTTQETEQQVRPVLDVVQVASATQTESRTGHATIDKRVMFDQDSEQHIKHAASTTGKQLANEGAEEESKSENGSKLLENNVTFAENNQAVESLAAANANKAASERKDKPEQRATHDAYSSAAASAEDSKKSELFVTESAPSQEPTSDDDASETQQLSSSREEQTLGPKSNVQEAEPDGSKATQLVDSVSSGASDGLSHVSGESSDVRGESSDVSGVSSAAERPVSSQEQAEIRKIKQGLVDSRPGPGRSFKLVKVAGSGGKLLAVRPTFRLWSDAGERGLKTVKKVRVVPKHSFVTAVDAVRPDDSRVSPTGRQTFSLTDGSVTEVRQTPPVARYDARYGQRVARRQQKMRSYASYYPWLGSSRQQQVPSSPKGSSFSNRKDAANLGSVFSRSSVPGSSGQVSFANLHGARFNKYGTLLNSGRGANKSFFSARYNG